MEERGEGEEREQLASRLASRMISRWMSSKYSKHLLLLEFENVLTRAAGSAEAHSDVHARPGSVTG